MSSNLKRFLSGSALLSALALPGLVFAEGGTITLDSNISGIDIASGLSGLGQQLSVVIIAGLGIAIACWGIMLGWKKLRGVIN